MSSRPPLSPLIIIRKSPHSTPRELAESPKGLSSPEDTSDSLQTPLSARPFQGFVGSSRASNSGALPHEEQLDWREQEHTNNCSASEGLPHTTTMFSSPTNVWASSNSSSLLFSTASQVFDLKEMQQPPAGSATSPLSHDYHNPSTSTSELFSQSPPKHRPPPILQFTTDASTYSTQFPRGHQLNSQFAQTYQLEDELGCGGYGFVMTAYNRVKGHEVAVKFIIKDKVPDHAWMDDERLGRMPTEVVLLSVVNHESIVKCLDLFEDDLYFYMVQELHGSPWHKDHKLDAEPSPSICNSSSSSSVHTPSLSPSSSEASLPSSAPNTPPHVFASLKPMNNADEVIPKLLSTHLTISPRPEVTRRASHDLFECIEQSEHKRLSESQARYVFSQVADAVEYLEEHGITHRDIKDENLVIDKNLKVKLIDFGSAIAVDPNQPRPFYKSFYGTAAYASSEILLKKDYQSAPAEIWTLGVLLSYLLAGVSPFPHVRDAVDGKIFLSEKIVGRISDDAMDLMRQCLDPNPDTRCTISQVKAHPWLGQK